MKGGENCRERKIASVIVWMENLSANYHWGCGAALFAATDIPFGSAHFVRSLLLYQILIKSKSLRCRNQLAVDNFFFSDLRIYYHKVRTTD